MSEEFIVIKADDESIISGLVSYIENQKQKLFEEMGVNLLTGQDRQAAVAAAMLKQLDLVQTVVKELIEEKQEENGDAKPSKSYFA
jgi:hypothetical protein